jgi:uncharacterized protein (UPF0332 family)
MIFTQLNDSNEDKELKILEEKYAVITESLDLFNQIFEGTSNEPITEADEWVIKEKVEDWIEDAHDFIDKSKAAGEKHLNTSRAAFLISLGLSLAAMIISMVAFTWTALIISIIALVGSLIALLIGYIKANDAQKEYNKLKDYKSKLLKMKSKTNSKKVSKKIDIIVKRIDGVVNA